MAESIIKKPIFFVGGFSWDGSRFPIPNGTPVPPVNQYCVPARNSADGSIYILTYFTPDTFVLTAVVSGSQPSIGNSVTVGYPI